MRPAVKLSAANVLVLAAATLGGAGLASSCGPGDSSTAGSPAGGGGQAGSSSSSSAGPGPVAVASGASTTTSTTVSTSSSGTGGGAPGWRPAPWWKGPCVIEVADDPADAFPPLEWASCSGVEGCEVLVKNWPTLSPAAIADPVVRKVSDGIEFAMQVVYPEYEARMPLHGSDGVARAVYRTPPHDPCLLTRLAPAQGGHWIGGQTAGPDSVYVFQPEGRPPEAATPLPFTDASQQSVGGESLFAIERDLGAGVLLFDRERGLSFEPPGGASNQLPQLTDDGALFLRFPTVGRPVAWSWSRASGLFAELIAPASDVVLDVRSDGQTLVWIESGPADALGYYPAGSLYTSPTTLDATNLVRTLRWEVLPARQAISPGAVGAGHYAFFSQETGRIHVVRLSDARMWTVTFPAELETILESIAFVDDEVLIYKTNLSVFRQRIDALGAGQLPP